MRLIKPAEKTLLCSVFFWCVLTPLQTAFCQIRLPRLISDGMVLQRDAEVKIWGWADANETLTVEFNGQRLSACADGDGRWHVIFNALKPGGPSEMQISGGGSRIVLKDIFVGDVWLCSGQSNMELPIDRVRERYPDVTKIHNTSIRQFTVPYRYDFKTPHDDLPSGQWVSASPETILSFSAVGWFFAEALYEQYKVPIGLILAAMGGSPAEAWLSEDALKIFPAHWETAMQFRNDDHIARIEKENQRTQDAWFARLNRLDKGLDNGRRPYLDADYDTSDWPTMKVPGYWADQSLGLLNGVVWFRKEFDVPPALAGKPAKLRLGCIVDSDEVYLNGTRVGSTSYQYPPRRYAIPENLLKSGRNIIVIRVVNSSGKGGFVPDKPYEIVAESKTIDLKGQWKYQLGAEMPPMPSSVFVRWKPLGLYNGMIAPLLNSPIKGVIWYQGESNVGRADEYKTLFPAVITDWRQKWNIGDFPFLYVQLANFLEAQHQPSESGWAELREAQLETLRVPNTAMAVAIDIGEWNDIHPLSKKDVGTRLALAARKLAYGDEVVYSGPLYRSMTVEGNRIRLSFTRLGGGLKAAQDGSLRHFAIAGADKKFVWANAEIDNNHVVVWSDAVQIPVAVRYAWADNPEGANLYNREGLPASPFRTDR